ETVDSTPASGDGTAVGDAAATWTERLRAFDWGRLSDGLTREGCVVLPELMDGSTCGEIRSLFDDDTLFVKTVVMDEPDFGAGVYRYFRSPIPAVVDGLRRAVYPHAARVANVCQARLGETTTFP